MIKILKHIIAGLATFGVIGAIPTILIIITKVKLWEHIIVIIALGLIGTCLIGLMLFILVGLFLCAKTIYERVLTFLGETK